MTTDDMKRLAPMPNSVSINQPINQVGPWYFITISVVLTVHFLDSLIRIIKCWTLTLCCQSYERWQRDIFCMSIPGIIHQMCRYNPHKHIARFTHRPTTSDRSYCESKWKNTRILSGRLQLNVSDNELSEQSYVQSRSMLCRISRWFLPGFMVNVKNVLNVWRLEKYNLQLW